MDKNLIIFGFSAFTVLAVVCSIFLQRKISKWPFVEGELLVAKVAEHSTNLHPEYFPEVKYTYVVEGKEYSGSRLSPAVFSGISAARLIKSQLEKIQLLPNGKVKIFYNPKNPKKSYLIKC